MHYIISNLCSVTTYSDKYILQLLNSTAFVLRGTSASKHFETDTIVHIKNIIIIIYYLILFYSIVTDLVNALPGKSSVNTAQQATTEQAVFSVDPTDAPIGWLDGDHVICLL
jgi:hypothetical protein